MDWIGLGLLCPKLWVTVTVGPITVGPLPPLKGCSALSVVPGRL